MSRKNLLIIAIVGVIIYIWVSRNPGVIKWFLSVDPTVMAAVITGSLTIVGSASITSINARRAQENAAAEANRGRKVEIYNEFVVSLMEMMNRLKGKDGEPTPEDVKFMHDFASQLMVHGGPAVIKGYGKWQMVGDSEQQDPQKMMETVENLLFVMREELGISNKGLKKNELLGLIIRGGKSELDKMGGSTQD